MRVSALVSERHTTAVATAIENSLSSFSIMVETVNSNALSTPFSFNYLLSTSWEARGVDVRCAGRSRESDTAESLSLFSLIVVVGDKLTHRICLLLMRVASPQAKKTCETVMYRTRSFRG